VLVACDEVVVLGHRQRATRHRQRDAFVPALVEQRRPDVHDHFGAAGQRQQLVVFERAEQHGAVELRAFPSRARDVHRDAGAVE
jgi:hypothetical protein